MVTGAEIPGNITNGLLSPRKCGAERVNQFMIKRLLSREVIVYDSIQRSTIVTSLKKKRKEKKQRKVIYVKEDCKALGLFVERYPEKHEPFNALTTFPLAISTTEGKLYQPKTKYYFINCFIELSNAKVSETNASLIVIFDAMAIVLSFPSLKTWESLFQTLVKAFRSQETILVFNNYTDNQESSLKQQDRINPFTNGTVRVYMGGSAQEMLQGKADQQYLENTGKKAGLTDRFTQHIQQDHVRSKLKGSVLLNSRDTTCRVNSSVFTSKPEEADTKIVYCSSSFKKPCIVKSTYIFLITYS